MIRVLFAVCLGLGYQAGLLFLPAVVTAQQPPITDLQFSPDGTRLVVGSQKGVQVLAWPSREPVRKLNVGFANLHALAFSPDSKRLAVGGGDPSDSGMVSVFSWPECKPVADFLGHGDSVTAIAWQNNQQLWSSSLDRTLMQWEFGRDLPLLTCRGHSRGVTSVDLLQDGLLVSAGEDRSLRVWDSATGELKRNLAQHTQAIHQLAVRPENEGLAMVATASADRTIRFWQPEIGRMMRFVRLKSTPLDCRWVGPQRMIVSCDDGSLQLIDTEQVEVMRSWPALNGWAYAVAQHPTENRWVVGGQDGEIRVLDPQADDLPVKSPN